MSGKDIDFSYVGKKLEFLAGHLELLEEYRNASFGDFRGRPKDEKYVEKVIQETVDCAVDINEFIVEYVAKEKPWSAKQSFRDLEEKVFAKKSFGLGEKGLKELIDTVSFRNEIVHSYDAGIVLLWSKRSVGAVIDAYKEYASMIMEFQKNAKR